MRIAAFVLLLLSPQASSQDKPSQAAVSEVARIESLILQYKQMQHLQVPETSVIALPSDLEIENQMLREDIKALRYELEDLRRRCK